MVLKAQNRNLETCFSVSSEIWNWRDVVLCQTKWRHPIKLNWIFWSKLLHQSNITHPQKVSVKLRLQFFDVPSLYLQFNIQLYTTLQLLHHRKGKAVSITVKKVAAVLKNNLVTLPLKYLDHLIQKAIVSQIWLKNWLKNTSNSAT